MNCFFSGIYGQADELEDKSKGNKISVVNGLSLDSLPSGGMCGK